MPTSAGPTPFEFHQDLWRQKRECLHGLVRLRAAILTQTWHVMDRQTDGRKDTGRQHIPRNHSSRGKNTENYVDFKDASDLLRFEDR